MECIYQDLEVHILKQRKKSLSIKRHGIKFKKRTYSVKIIHGMYKKNRSVSLYIFFLGRKINFFPREDHLSPKIATVRWQNVYRIRCSFFLHCAKLYRSIYNIIMYKRISINTIYKEGCWRKLFLRIICVFKPKNVSLQ